MLFYNLGGLQDSQQISSSYVQTTMASFFGRINYKFNEKYLMTVTLRQDGSSVLAKDHQWGVFPSVALAWRMNEENFLKNVEQLSNLKLRLSYGISGNSAVSAYQTQGGLGKTCSGCGALQRDRCSSERSRPAHGVRSPKRSLPRCGRKQKGEILYDGRHPDEHT